jgi:hypothetical protein
MPLSGRNSARITGSALLLVLVPKLRLGTHSPKLRFVSILAPKTRTRNRIYESEVPYFLTCRIVGWVAAFTGPEAAQIGQAGQVTGVRQSKVPWGALMNRLHASPYDIFSP